MNPPPTPSNAPNIPENNAIMNSTIITDESKLVLLL